MRRWEWGANLNLKEVTARVQAPDNAIAGDYVVTFRARPEDVSAESLERRVTVRTSTLWGVAGVALSMLLDGNGLRL